jgi:predicted component of type VI protein secretion system
LTIGPDGTLNIRDLESTGGTFILRNRKEQPVTQARLQRTDTLRLGDYEIPVEELLTLVRETEKGASFGSAGKAISKEEPEKPKTRMVRCACGSIKPRDQACPACGT